MYKVTQRYYNNGKIWVDIQPANPDDISANATTEKYDEYIDVFKTKEEAERFYKDALNA